MSKSTYYRHNRISYILLGLLSLCLNGCDRPDLLAANYTGQCPPWQAIYGCEAVPFSGVRLSENRAVPPFESVYVAGNAHYTLIGGTAPHEVHADGDSGILNNTAVYVKDHVLYVTMDPNYHYENTTDTHITIKVPHINVFRFEGGGEAILKNLDSHELIVEASGVGKIRLFGRVANLHATLAGEIFLDVTHLDVNETLTNLVTGSSKIEYYARPLGVSTYTRGASLVNRMQGLRVDTFCHQAHGCRPPMKLTTAKMFSPMWSG